MLHKAETLIQEFAIYTRDTEQHEDVLSLYLVVDPANEQNQGQAKWPIFLKNALAEIEKGLDPEQTKQWKNIRLSDLRHAYLARKLMQNIKDQIIIA